MSAIFLFLVHFFFRPDPPIVVSRETTYITAPLRSDGLPDYEQYMLNANRKGATHDNNAAVLVWQALWPNNLDPPDYEPMRAELGFKELPPTSRTLQLPFGKENEKRVEAWWKKQHPNSKDVDTLDIMDLATKFAWTSREFPPMAEWVRANKKPIDLIVEATRRPRFYSPSPSLLGNYKGLLITMLLPGIHNTREAAQALSIRAMLHIGENRLDEAWIDLMAIHRLARLAAQAPTSIDQTVAMSISQIGCRGTLILLSNDHLTPELARRVNKDLAALLSFSNALGCANNFERLAALDVALDVKRHGADAIIERPKFGPDVTKVMSFDWNVTFRRINYWYDRLVTTMQFPNREARKRAYVKFHADLSADGHRSDRPMQLIVAAFSIHRRSEMMGGFIAAQMLSEIGDPMEFEERTNTSLQLMRVAAALAVFRAEHHAYPAKLSDLVPALLEKPPVDVYNARPFPYQRIGAGYLLYSVGENGVDNGGSHKEWDIFEGQSLDELKNSDPKKTPPLIPAGADDISIRVPGPPSLCPGTNCPVLPPDRLAPISR
jgi:hypothetical protein